MGSTIAGQSDSRALVAGDWDGNGDLDLASANNGVSQVALLLNDGTGVFTLFDTVPGLINTRGLVAGDWNGDDDLDLASANFGAGAVDVLQNQP